MVKHQLVSIIVVTSYLSYDVVSIHSTSFFVFLTGNFGAWRRFVSRNAMEFSKLVDYWLKEANISSVLVVKYEDMLTDFAGQLRKMLDFLRAPYSDKDIECVLNNKLESYHRPKGVSFEHYNPADRQLVLGTLMSIEPLLNKYNVSYKDVLTQFQNVTTT